MKKSRHKFTYTERERESETVACVICAAYNAYNAHTHYTFDAFSFYLQLASYAIYFLMITIIPIILEFLHCIYKKKTYRYLHTHTRTHTRETRSPLFPSISCVCDFSCFIFITHSQIKFEPGVCAG